MPVGLNSKEVRVADDELMVQRTPPYALEEVPAIPKASLITPVTMESEGSSSGAEERRNQSTVRRKRVKARPAPMAKQGLLQDDDNVEAIARRRGVPKRVPKDRTDDTSDDAEFHTADSAFVPYTPYKSADSASPSPLNRATHRRVSIAGSENTPILSPPGSSLSSALTSPGRRPAWQRGQLLGKGSYGSVYLGVRPNGSLMAVKCVHMNDIPPDSVDSVVREVEVMHNLSHENIVRYLGAAVDDFTNELHIFMEYIQGGTLGSLVRRLEQPLQESTVVSYVRQILRGVAYLHTNNIIHRDLKGDNILLQNQGQVKLTDFGTSKCLGTEGQRASAAKTMAGTPLWMAPEVINSGKAKNGYTFVADIWSVGIVICELLARGKTPWPVFDSCWQAVFTIGCWKEELPPEVPEGLSDACMDLLRTCLNPDPALRKSAAELLLHSWLQHEEPEEDSFIQHSKADSLQEIRTRTSSLLQGSQAQSRESVDLGGSAVDSFKTDLNFTLSDPLGGGGLRIVTESVSTHDAPELTEERLSCFDNACECDGCGAFFADGDGLADHKESEKCGALHGCGEPGCTETFGNRDRLRCHHADKHVESKKAWCDGCSGVFVDQEAVERHKEEAKCGIVYGCSYPDCLVFKASRARLTSHMTEAHPDYRPPTPQWQRLSPHIQPAPLSPMDCDTPLL